MGCVGLTISSTFCCFSRRKGDLTSRAICRKHSIVTSGVCCLGGDDDYDDDDESSECRKVRMVVVNERSRSVTIYKGRDRCQLRNTKSKDSASSSNQQIDQQKSERASEREMTALCYVPETDWKHCYLGGTESLTYPKQGAIHCEIDELSFAFVIPIWRGGGLIVGGGGLDHRSAPTWAGWPPFCPKIIQKHKGENTTGGNGYEVNYPAVIVTIARPWIQKMSSNYRDEREKKKKRDGGDT
ncbi:uncharacterized protein An15g05900 [Aspergillus niger]|uniref:Contig An15c0200, genomic contig n=2 Tax=Aspergillus niger TaxID=5061 RepID=A2R5X6_ASPNC|nr:uncharacterized protein An15g05900 [Aspergillus niger]CAK42543.1 unnamed protein product [Aspergillus niger]